MEEVEYKVNINVDVFYPKHEHPRKEQGETPVFRHTKDYWHKTGIKCVVCNKDCSGQTEIHHKHIEWADTEIVDWEKVKPKHPDFDWPNFDPIKPELFIDSIYNTEPRCELHHRGPAPYSVHFTPGPICNIQMYMKDDFIYTKVKNDSKGNSTNKSD